MSPKTQSQNLLNCVRGKSMDRHGQEESDLIETLQNSKFESLIPNKPSSVLSSSGKGISIDHFHALRDQELAKSKRNISLDREHNVLKKRILPIVGLRGGKTLKQNLRYLGIIWMEIR